MDAPLSVVNPTLSNDEPETELPSNTNAINTIPSESKGTLPAQSIDTEEMRTWWRFTEEPPKHYTYHKVDDTLLYLMNYISKNVFTLVTMYHVCDFRDRLMVYWDFLKGLHLLLF